MKRNKNMKFGLEWRCGNCGQIYSTDEFLILDKVKLVESDTDPVEQHGYTPACKCGYRFHLDKWRLYDNLKIKIDSEDINVLVSTIDLELNHGYDKDLWYETMIFVDEDKILEDVKIIKIIEDKTIECNYERRYETKDDAIADHNRILNLLRDEKYSIEETGNKKILRIDEEG